MLEGVCGSAREVDCGRCLEASLGTIYLIDDRTKTRNEVKISSVHYSSAYFISSLPFKSVESLKAPSAVHFFFKFVTRTHPIYFRFLWLWQPGQFFYCRCSLRPCY